MSFLNDPDFPGNPGWNEKLKKSMSFLDDPDFPGNPGWNEKQKKSMSYLKDPYFPGNPGWLANLKRETTLPTNCSKINDVLGTTTFPSHSPNTVVYGPGGYPTYLSYLPATKTTYYCNDPVFYDQPFLMLETRTTINNGNRTSVHSAYTLYNLQGMQFKQGNVVKSTEVGNNYVNNYF
ncbi:uncharacterized protein LOC142332170 [Lycorma delicatula]|uniref:uncharacterized protein LOC142332170 n=1 Tax=Lycorma delicatula TaxID=130591 RepID=UPI003F517476